MKHLPKPLKFFLFEGKTNTAEEFKAQIFGAPISESQAFETQDKTCETGSSSTTSPCLKSEPGAYSIFHNWNNGRSEVWGIVVGKNKRQAWILLKRFENKFNRPL